MTILGVIAFLLGILVNVWLGIKIKRIPSSGTIILILLTVQAIVLGLALAVQNIFNLSLLSEETVRFLAAAGGIAVAAVSGQALLREFKEELERQRQ